MGRAFGEYEVIDSFDCGSCATIHRVKHKDETLPIFRAVKELVLNFNDYSRNDKEKLTASFQKECKELLRLGNGGHPNIVRIYQYRDLEKEKWLLMDFIKGCNIEKYLEKKNKFIVIEEVMRFVKEISSALAYCHEDIYEFCNDSTDDITDEIEKQKLIQKYKVVHNDLHHKNIIRRKYDGSYILLDFGMAIKGGEKANTIQRNEGIPEYKAPEKFNDKDGNDIEGDNNTKITEQSDIYSFGILMYEMLAGQPPFVYNKDDKIIETENDYSQLWRKHKKVMPPPIEPLRRANFEKNNPGKTFENYPDWLEKVIMKCLEKKPEDRYQNGKELYKDVIKHMSNDNNTGTKTDDKTIDNLNNQLSALKSEKTALSEQLDDEKQKNNNLESLHATLEVKCEVLIEKNKALDTQLSASARALDASAREITKLNAIILKLKKDLSKKTNKRIVPVLSVLCLILSAATIYFGVKPKTIKPKYFEPEMVFVEGGSFMMGCTSEQGNDCWDDEKTIRRVTVSSFNIGKYLVTQGEWKAIMKDNPSHFNKGDNYPVETVNWDDVELFLKRLNAATGKEYRLPTEAEWEYAARGGNQTKGYKYSGSNSLNQVAWWRDNSVERTYPVGIKAPNELGVYDMSGNVAEWCSDWYNADYPAYAQQNPTGSLSGTHRIIRGGNWNNIDNLCRVAARNRCVPEGRANSIGFRVVIAHSNENNEDASSDVTVNEDTSSDVTVNEDAPSNVTVNEDTPSNVTANENTPSNVTVNENAPPANSVNYLEKRYSFGRYQGELRNNIPHGGGRMFYSKSVQIAKHNGKNCAEAGDVFVGNWYNGDIEFGRLYDNNGNLRFLISPSSRQTPYDISNDDKPCE